MKQRRYVLVRADGTDRLLDANGIPYPEGCKGPASVHPEPPFWSILDSGGPESPAALARRLVRNLLELTGPFLHHALDGHGPELVAPLELPDKVREIFDAGVARLAELGAGGLGNLLAEPDPLLVHPRALPILIELVRRIGFEARPAVSKMLEKLFAVTHHHLPRTALMAEATAALAAAGRENVLPFLLRTGWVPVRETPAGDGAGGVCFLVLLERDVPGIQPPAE